MNSLVASLPRSVGRAVYVSAACDLTCRALAIILSISVARILEPREVGLLGLAVLVVGVLSQLSFYSETACVTTRSAGSDTAYAAMAVLLRTVITAMLAFLALVSAGTF